MQVRLLELLFDGTGNSDAKYTVELDGFTGLFGGLGVKAETLSRPFAHGDYSLPLFREARVLRLRGHVFSDGLFNQQLDLTVLGGVLADGGRTQLSVEADMGSRWCTVELADAPDIEILVPGRVARYQLVLRATDPRWYGAPQRYSGNEVSVFHYGTADAWPSVEVLGGRAPYTISGPGGRRVEITQPLAGGSKHVFEFKTGRLFKDGVLQVGAVGRADVWPIPAGSPVTMSMSSGSMNVLLDDTYL